MSPSTEFLILFLVEGVLQRVAISFPEKVAAQIDWVTRDEFQQAIQQYLPPHMRSWKILEADVMDAVVYIDNDGRRAKRPA